MTPLRDRFASLPALPFAPLPSPLESLDRLRTELSPRLTLLVKRDDAIGFGFGGNKVRKLRLVAAQAIADGADTLITCGGIQSNHARATAAYAARLGLRCILVANGTPQPAPTGNALLAQLLGAEIRYVSTREERAPAMARAAAQCAAGGGRPFVIPLGASTPLGAAAYALAIGELLQQHQAPDVIVHATSSGGTQAGLVAGCRLHGLATRVIGVSADDPAQQIEAEVRRILEGLETLAGIDSGAFDDVPVEVDDRFVGSGYGQPTPGSIESQRMAARHAALFLDNTYTAKAMSGLAARARAGEFDGATVVFWHTGGQVGLFA
ncbi:MAG TPA: pyridoxal-phosphate dependent enzyme [Vicinamibacterales bacterium]|jgi:1-aminocyclopropane-1-carboxylate deaminase/D-cysteine desulfhydrase-like pyridoxal-dependent ACC family enzyme|nr:pyridoxal-phosphate dependent enzyme [Vicinamibacterales bacterium]